MMGRGQDIYLRCNRIMITETSMERSIQYRQNEEKNNKYNLKQATK
jgi:hypothetical protein